MRLGRQVFKMIRRLALALFLLFPFPSAFAQFNGLSFWQHRFGFLVISAGATTGNLGGLAGANSFCYTELNANNWRGKTDALPLSPAKVRAFLCDSTTCNNLRPNQYYKFASSGFATEGGDIFKTDASGNGPGTATNWTTMTTFNAPMGYRYWTGRGAGTSTTWASTPDPVDTCNNWTNSTAIFGGINGNPGYADSRRWAEPPAAGCSSNFQVLCIVDP